MAPAGNSSPTKRLKVSKLKVFLLALSYSYVTKSLALSYSRSMITQIERRFNIPSSLVGVIDGSFDIGNLLAIAFVSYFGAKSHRPRVMAAGCLVMFLGGCLTALPHFIMRQYQYDRAHGVSTNSTSHVQLCLANQSHASEAGASEECKSGSESHMWIFVLVGNILQGIGETPIEPLGLSYVDDFAKADNSPFYIGIIQTISIGGPFLGSLMAAFFAQIYVDVGFVNLDDVTLGLTDTRWVGAWWLGFLISATLNLLAAVPFWFFPKSLPKEGEEDPPEAKEMLQPLAEEKRIETPDQKVVEFLPFLKRLLGNRVFMLFLVVTVLQFNAFVGFFSFMPKYVEQQYGKSASEAIFLIGVYNLPVICIGYFLGGFFMKKFKVTTFLAAKIGFWSSVVEYLIYFSAFAMLCRNAVVAGLTVSYDGVEETSYLDNLRSDCNRNCDCPTDIWDPVCGDNGVSYVSACLAGCDYSTGWGQEAVFRNCSCIPGLNSSAVLGQCPREGKCDTMLLYFMILSLVCCLIYSFGAMPGYMVLIRSLTPEEKAFGLGLHLLAARALGGIPSPIYYGALIDTTCIKWGTTSCGEPGACRMYDSDAYR
ncbi:solute carrier organic anion transporter family member 1A2-like [Spea bombifrons]|uniref:solute carrier organic anion transporter family member 1A2-like n=1 Tax=Spea bombifrons TaxID=233779 RepID=UPI00234ADB10|nr:solute carrier organic anion transporter family member 1A2-like [Spea bombifrons]